MTERLLRGRVLRFLSEPAGIDDHTAYAYDEDGAILVRDGLVAAVGPAEEVMATAAPGDPGPRPPPAPADARLHRHPHPHAAGAGDRVLGRAAARLAEHLHLSGGSGFADPAHAARIAGLFLDELLRHGTTTAVAFCSVHPTSADAFFEAAAARNLRMIGGKVMMDRNAPEAVLDTPQSSYDDIKALIARWHGRGRALYAISPRFAITSTPAQMEMAQALVAEHPDLHMQTHLSENRDEIDFTPRSTRTPATTSTSTNATACSAPRASSATPSTSPTARPPRWPPPARSPSSARPQPLPRQRALRQGRPAEKGVRRAIATDVGGGTNYSMLRTLDEGYKVLALRGQKLDPLKAFWWITRGNADALGLADRIGTLAPVRGRHRRARQRRDPGHGAPPRDSPQPARGALPAADARRRPGGGRNLRRRGAVGAGPGRVSRECEMEALRTRNPGNTIGPKDGPLPNGGKWLIRPWPGRR